MATNLAPVGGTVSNGPVVYARWSSDTGQDRVHDYLWGVDEEGVSHGNLPLEGSYPWSADSGAVAAPAGATRVAFFFGLRKCGGTVKYRDLYIQLEP